MKIVKRLILIVFLLILAIGIIFGVYGYTIYSKAIKEVPLADKIEEIKSDKNYVKIEDLPEDYLNAVVSVEDRRFYNHGAIDFKSIARAIYVNIKNFELREGGSTLT